MYDTCDIKAHPRAQLGPDDFLLIALLAGGDYSPGIDGCGIHVTAALAQAGLGKALVRAIRDPHPNSLSIWRDILINELRTNSSGEMARKNPNLAANVPIDFPNIHKVDLYLHPITSENNAGHLPYIIPISNVDVCQLSNFVQQHFGWAQDPICLYSNFAKNFFLDS
ncbi:hypothetical protein H0H92_008635 [Tricholoma furcatifolium]|nr:hypothetical protein H0H92_008635 [Tricholoma furcatifolium]